jgi:hypothetical protein
MLGDFCLTPNAFLYARVAFGKEKDSNASSTLVDGFAFALACGTSKAQNNCVSYFDPPPKHCTGSGGCDTFVPVTSCIMGCIRGTCNPQGNVASCCGVASYYAQIFPDGGICSGQNCGLSRINLAKKMRANFERLNAQIIASASRADAAAPHLYPKHMNK